MMIGKDYGIEINSYDVSYDEYHNHIRGISQDEYYSHIRGIVERFKFDIDDFKERLVKIIKDDIKIELKER